jgi:pantothenate kinase
MDGYHLPRSRLDAEGLRRRGALHTFDGEAFRTAMELLRRTRSGIFPAFDHAEKDPRPGAVCVTPDARLVIVEGIYVLMRAWRSEHLFDLRVFLDCDLDEAVGRLTSRHVETGLASTAEEGLHRAVTNDRLNAEVILADGCRERADLILRSHGSSGNR